MRVAVVDDKTEDRRAIAEMAAARCEALRQHVQVQAFESGAALLSAWGDDGFDVVLLDIYMDGMDGMETAKAVRRKSRLTKLVFVTVTGAFALQGYEVGATHYLVKPVAPEKLQTALARCFAEIDGDARFSVLKEGYKQVKVLHRNILFIRVKNGYSHVHTTGGVQVKVHRPLQALIEDLGDARFLICYQNAAVNLQHVVGITPQENGFELDNGAVVPFVKKQRKDMKNAWVGYEARFLDEG